MKNKNSSTIERIILLVCIAGFLGCAGWLMYYFFGNSRAQQHIDDVKENYVRSEAIETSEPVPVATQIPVSTPEPTAEPEGVVIDGICYPGFDGLEVPERVIDFAALQSEENEHVYAWIYIPNTNVDYPILQHPEDPDYYLRRDIKGDSATAGCIFTQYYNKKDFNDNNTVIYGHNMKNGTMFKTIHYYEDSQFFEENPYIYIYTPTDTRVYQVFAAYEYSDAHLLLNFDMNDDASFGKYLEGLADINGSKDHFNWEIGVTSEDKIITLSTCVANKATNRYLVQAKLIAVEETALASEE